MLPSKPSFGEVWITHKSLGSSSINSKIQTPMFHTLGSMQGIEVKLDEHKELLLCFNKQQNIMYKWQIFYLDFLNKQIIEEKDKSIQNLQGDLEKEQKLKAKLQDRNNENN